MVYKKGDLEMLRKLTMQRKHWKEDMKYRRGEVSLNARKQWKEDMNYRQYKFSLNNARTHWKENMNYRQCEVSLNNAEETQERKYELQAV